MAERVNPKITKMAHSYYQDHFGSVRKGVTYVLESLPQLLERTWVEIKHVLEPNEVKVLMKSLSEWDKPFPFSGMLPLELAPAGAKARMKDLPLFARITLELAGFAKGDRLLTETSRGEVQLSLDLSKECRAFVEEQFSDFSPGCAFLLDLFPVWAEQTLSALPAAEKKRSLQAMRGDVLDNPFLAGRLLPLRMITLVQTGQVRKAPGLPAFTTHALEVEAMTAKKKKKAIQTSPKLSPVVGESLADLFGNTNVGAALALTSFPRIYEQTLAEEIHGLFTREDLKKLHELLKNHDLVNPNTVGDLVVVAMEDMVGDLPAKIHALSPFGRVCLEVILARIGLWNKYPRYEP